MGFFVRLQAPTRDAGSILTAVDPIALEGLSTTRCVVLRMDGLLWSLRSGQSLATEIPTWDAAVAPTRKYSTSEMTESLDAGSGGAVSDLDCFDFQHPDNGGTRITVVFPDSETCLTTLEICQKFGGSMSPESTAAPALAYSLSMGQRSGKNNNAGGAKGLRRARKSLPDPGARRKLEATVAGGKRVRDKSRGTSGSAPSAILCLCHPSTLSPPPPLLILFMLHPSQNRSLSFFRQKEIQSILYRPLQRSPPSTTNNNT